MGWEVRNLTIIPSQQSKLELLTPPHSGVGIDSVYGPRNTTVDARCRLEKAQKEERRKERRPSLEAQGDSTVMTGKHVAASGASDSYWTAGQRPVEDCLHTGQQDLQKEESREC